MINPPQYQQSPSFLHINAVFIISLATLFMGGASFFALRHPLVMVSDDAFETLYGERRAANARLSISLSLFRPVRTAMIAASASAEAVADAAELTGGRRAPVGVFFPDRYLAGARIYLMRFPERKVIVLGDPPETAVPGRPVPPPAVVGSEGSALIFFGPDRENDLYRAGMIAGFIPKEGRPAIRFGMAFDKSREEARSAFSTGFAASGSNLDPFFLNPGDPLPVSAENISVLIDAAPSLGLPSNSWMSVPRFVFSWIDPELADPSVLLFIDDSPYSLAIAALNRGSGKTVRDRAPSRFVLTVAGNGVPGLAKALRMMAKSSIP